MVRLYAVKLPDYRTHHLQTARRRVLLPQQRLLTERKDEPGVWSLESGYLTTLYSCDDCQRRVPISSVRRQASDPCLTLTTVGESGDGVLPEPLPGLGLSVM